jgi:hypothetical protein
MTSPYEPPRAAGRTRRPTGGTRGVGRRASDVAEEQRNGGVARHRRLEAEVLVVVPDVLGECLFQVTRPEDEGPVHALSLYGPIRTKRFT